VLGAAAALSMVAVTHAGPALAAGDAVSYHAAVVQAIDLVNRARGGETGAAQRAATILRATPGFTDEDLLYDLGRRPPDLDDAGRRLAVLEGASRAPADTPNPDTARSRLKQILSDPRYLESGPSLWDQFQAWLIRGLGLLLSALFSGRGGEVLALLIEVLVVVAAIAIAVLFLVRLLINRRAHDARQVPPPPRSELAVDIFAEADRCAAAGDYVRALRALTAGVAASLGGERVWEASPLTIRELFVRRAVLDPLRPLLVPFEALSYGRREPDATIYVGAAAAAAPFRQASA
jgi:hypothetical protein